MERYKGVPERVKGSTGDEKKVIMQEKQNENRDRNMQEQRGTKERRSGKEQLRDGEQYGASEQRPTKRKYRTPRQKSTKNRSIAAVFFALLSLLAVIGMALVFFYYRKENEALRQELAEKEAAAAFAASEESYTKEEMSQLLAEQAQTLDLEARERFLQELKEQITSGNGTVPMLRHFWNRLCLRIPVSIILWTSTINCRSILMSMRILWSLRAMSISITKMGSL